MWFDWEASWPRAESGGQWLLPVLWRPQLLDLRAKRQLKKAKQTEKQTQKADHNLRTARLIALSAPCTLGREDHSLPNAISMNVKQELILGLGRRSLHLHCGLPEKKQKLLLHPFTSSLAKIG